MSSYKECDGFLYRVEDLNIGGRPFSDAKGVKITGTIEQAIKEFEAQERGEETVTVGTTPDKLTVFNVTPNWVTSGEVVVDKWVTHGVDED